MACHNPCGGGFLPAAMAAPPDPAAHWKIPVEMAGLGLVARRSGQRSGFWRQPAADTVGAAGQGKPGIIALTLGHDLAL